MSVTVRGIITTAAPGQDVAEVDVVERAGETYETADAAVRAGIPDGWHLLHVVVRRD